MPICQHCQKRWSWKLALKRSFTLNPYMICPYCGAKQYMTKRARNRSLAFNFIPPLFILLPLLFDVSLWITISFIVGSGLLILCFYPFMIELSNEEETIP